MRRGQVNKMKEILSFDSIDDLDVYSQYFNAHAVYEGIERRAAIVKLTLMSDMEGNKAYKISVSFFPFEDPEDFRVTSDCYVEKIMELSGKRRSRKKEDVLMNILQKEIDKLSETLDAQAEVYWDKPLREARTA